MFLQEAFLLKTFEPACQWQGPPPSVRAVCRISAGDRGDKEPQIPGQARPSASRKKLPVLGCGTENWSSVSARACGGQMGHSRLHLPAPHPRGDYDRRSQGGRAPVPLHPAAVCSLPPPPPPSHPPITTSPNPVPSGSNLAIWVHPQTDFSPLSWKG